MLAYRTELRNSPKEQTIKIYLSNTSLDNTIKELIQKINGVRLVELQDSLSRNRVEENITIYRNTDISINILKEKIDDFLESYFERVDI